MKVLVRYVAQLKQAAGRSSEVIEIPERCTIGELLALLSRQKSVLAPLLIAEGKPQRTLLIFVGDEQVRADHALSADDDITLMTPIAGGLPCPCRDR